MQPEKMLDLIGIKEGMVIGEVGAGYGYFTVKLAKRVGPQGIIYASDIDNNSLKALKKRAVNDGLKNIKVILAEKEDPLFPNTSLDMVIMVWVINVFDKPIEYFKKVKYYLKSNSPLVIINYDPAKLGKKKGVYNGLWKEDILNIAAKAGYKIVKIETSFKYDNVYIFKQEKEVKDKEI
jgi:ubiquinone/menaquinone biosynthesis C-methylase UbiE